MTTLPSPWANDTASGLITSLSKVAPSDIRNYLQNKHKLLIPLKNRSLIKVEGQDSISFLQGQCTCDFGRLKRYQHIIGAHCNIKGRMHTSFTAAGLSSHEKPAVGLRINTSVSDYAVAQLQKYAVFSKLSLTLDTDHVCAALFLPAAPINNMIGNNVRLPEVGNYAISPVASGTIVILRHQPRLLEIWASPTLLGSWLDPFMEDVLVAPETLWDFLQISAGIGELSDKTQGMLLPQELNFQLLDGVAFDKGCYTGQEVIARLHYRGKLKKHLYHAQWTGSTFPKQGENLVDTNGKTIGQVINIVIVGDTCVHALILCPSSVYGNDAGVFYENKEIKLRWHDLPYAIT